MTPDDYRLSAVLAAFAPGRVGDLAAQLGGKPAAEVRAAAEALVRAGRSARLAALSRVLTPEHPALAAAEETIPPRGGGEWAASQDQVRCGRLRRRLRLEAEHARSTSAARTAVQPRAGGHAEANP